MKKWCLIVIAFLALASIVSAQTVSTAELKSTLIDAIKDYLSSQTPKLEKAELKDLIVIYLSTKGDTADLSGNGVFSGKKFINIYNKAKGIITIVPQPPLPRPAGTNVLNKEWYGGHLDMGAVFTIAPGEEKRFLIELPNGLPDLTGTGKTRGWGLSTAKSPNTNYDSLQVTFGPSDILTFDVTIITPTNKEYKNQSAGMLAFMSAPPGRYLVKMKVPNIRAPAGIYINWHSNPHPLQEELAP